MSPQSESSYFRKVKSSFLHLEDGGKQKLAAGGWRRWSPGHFALTRFSCFLADQFG
jgi:hypothetical protein